MIISDNSNIYEFNALGVIALYGEALEATPNCTLGIISSGALSEAARKALTASAVQLGFGKQACAWIQTEGCGESPRLGAEDLSTIIEGLDPVALVVTDAKACALLEKGYSTPLKLDERNRLLCRTVIAFSDFASLLENEDAKQVAWHLLKGLK